MRALLISMVLIAGCSHPVDKAAKEFCINTQMMFWRQPALDVASQVLSAGKCRMLNEASHDLAVRMVGFQAAANPFRGRPEVRRTLAALDKLPLDEVFALHCDDQVAATPEQIAALLPKIESVRAKLAAVSAACDGVSD